MIDADEVAMAWRYRSLSSAGSIPPVMKAVLAAESAMVRELYSVWEALATGSTSASRVS